MIALLKLVPIWAWGVAALVIALALTAGYQTLQLADVRTEYAGYRADIETKAAEASEQARQTEQQRQRDIDQVRNDAQKQKAADDAAAARLTADGQQLRDQTRKLLADRAALNSRLAERGKTIADLADLLSELRSEADRYAGELAGALTASRRSGFACERAYDSIKQ